MSVWVENVRRFYCDLCDFTRELRPGEEAPRCCPACGNGDRREYSKATEEAKDRVRRGEGVQDGCPLCEMAKRELGYIYESADGSDAGLYNTVKHSMKRMTGSAVWTEESRVG